MYLNDRILSIPDPKFQKLYTKKNHFRKKTDGSDEAMAFMQNGASSHDDDEEFDKYIAQYAMNSPDAKSKPNPLFMNTR